MTLEERIQEAYKEAEHDINPGVDNLLAETAFEAGYRACMNQEEWKNLYAAGIRSGLRSALDMGVDTLRRVVEESSKPQPPLSSLNGVLKDAEDRAIIELVFGQPRLDNLNEALSDIPTHRAVNPIPYRELDGE